MILASDGPSLDPPARAALLGVARSAIEAALLRERREPSGWPEFARGGGAFVSLHERGGSLRGCVGCLRSDDPLDHTVARVAVLAATGDGRFPPVEAGELPRLRIEISALSAPRGARPDEVEVGRHGLWLRVGSASGVLLPQVAKGRGWSAQTFLDETARKAGLPAQAWRGADAHLYVFTAEVFGED